MHTPGDTAVNLYELQRFRRSSLPLAFWSTAQQKPHELIHTHDCYEILIINTGTGWCSMNGLRFPIMAGDVYILRPGDLHEYSANPGMKYHNMMFSREIFTENEAAVFHSLLDQSGKYILPGEEREKLKPLFAELENELKTAQPGAAVAAKALFLRFMVALLRLRSSAVRTMDDKKEAVRISQMFEFITQHCCEKLTLNDLALAIGHSPEYTGRLFKRLTGTAFTDYLINCRIDLACGRLKNTDKPVSEIAMELGFFDTPYFDKCFRKVLHMSPTEYRKQR